MSRTVMLRSGPGVLDDIRAAIAESEIPEEERVMLCSPTLMAWIVRRVGALPPEEMRRQLGAELLGVGYLETRRILVTDRETARKIAPASDQAGQA